MKIFYKLSKLKNSKHFPHDAKLIIGIQAGLVVFLIISSITVFSGIKTHIQQYIFGLSNYVRMPIYLVSYLVGSLLIDIVNAICIAYIISAILRKEYKRTDMIVLMIFCGLVSAGLTYYSYNMSQNSAMVVGKDITKINQVDDTSTLNQLEEKYQTNKASIEAQFEKSLHQIIAPFDDQISNTEATFDNQIAVLKNEIAVIDKNTTKDNYLYAAKKKRPITQKITQLEAEKLEALSPILTRKEAAIEDQKKWKDQELRDAKHQYQADRAKKELYTTTHNSTATTLGDFFSFLFAKIAGFACPIYLILTAMREIVFHRNGIEPTPILSNFDFSPWWVIEIINFPFVWVRNHSVALIREQYKRLPNPDLPNIDKNIWDGESLNQQVVEPTASITASHFMVEEYASLRTSSDIISASTQVEDHVPLEQHELEALRQLEEDLDKIADDLQVKEQEQDQREQELNKIQEQLQREQERLVRTAKSHREQEQEQEQEQAKEAPGPKSKTSKKTSVLESIKFAIENSHKGVLENNGKKVIEHKGKNKDGTITTKYYKRSEVTSFVGKYDKRLRAALARPKEDQNPEVIENNRNWKAYWLGRLPEFGK